MARSVIQCGRCGLIYPFAQPAECPNCEPRRSSPRQRGRRVPPPIIVVNPPPPPTNGFARGLRMDIEYFDAHPTVDGYMRAYIPGECEPDWPAGTQVYVKRLGNTRARAFILSKDLEVQN
jgi:hypothetical protein